LQIYTLYRLTKEFFKDSNTSVAMCWIPGEGKGMHHFDGFNNDVTVYSYKQILNECRVVSEILFHTPEYATMKILGTIGWNRLAELKRDINLKINILNQHMLRMVTPEEITKIKLSVPSITCAAAHYNWVRPDERQRLNVPLHYLPTWYYQDDAPWQPYESKKNLMIVSPDANPNRTRVLEAIKNANPGLEIKVIQDIKYEQYTELERCAKWSLTFGEGHDGYFYGPVLRGGVSFAVRNDTFEYPGFEELKTVYDSYDAMVEKIGNSVRELDNKNDYEAYNRVLRATEEKFRALEYTSQAMSDFYRGKYTLP